MRIRYHRLNERGFSLIELMIVVGLIGVLTTMAIPRFQAFQAKAKIGEAKNLLTHIYTLQQSYHLDNNVYVAWPTVYGRNGNTNNCNPHPNARLIGFRIEPCVANDPVPRYGYLVPTANASAFQARAQTGAAAANLVCPGDPAQTIIIDQSKRMTGQLNGCS